MRRLSRIAVGVLAGSLALSVLVRIAPAEEKAFQGTLLAPAAQCLSWCGSPTEECVNAGGSCKVIGVRCLCIIPVH